MKKATKKIKLKIKKSIRKRFKITGTGKMLRAGSFLRHLRRKKSKKQIRSLKVPKVVSGKLEKKIKKALGK